MRNFLPATATIVALLAGAPAHAAEGSRPKLPDAATVEAHVRTHWRNYEVRLGLFPRGSAALVAVRKISCGYNWEIPECSFEVTARSAAGEERTKVETSLFEWNDHGGLDEVVIIADTIIQPNPSVPSVAAPPLPLAVVPHLF